MMDPLSKIVDRKNSVGCLSLMSPKPSSPVNYSKVHNQTHYTKSKSLPAHSSIKNFDKFCLNVLSISADELANQLTLLDFAVFKLIQPEELSSCAWTRKDKNTNTPNIVAFTKRFNHTIFWIVQEILSFNLPKQRAELLSHFMKMAKKLHNLNNLHSLFAVISALQSASIYRLEKTWSYLSKKDKQTFEKLREVFSDENNWRHLRNHLDSLRLPCIPYLGLFLTDLIYIDMAHPQGASYFEPSQRRNKINNILRIISNYQQSNYSHLEPDENIQQYIKSICYIEELQNIFEDDQYKKSLLLEPHSLVVSRSESCSSKESISVETLTNSLANLNKLPSSTIHNGSLRLDNQRKHKPGHRKCNSLGSNIFWKLNWNENNLCKKGKSEPNSKQRNLLDDSVLETNVTGHNEGISSDNLSKLMWPQNSTTDVTASKENAAVQGCMRRKTLQKNWRKPTIAKWQRYWLQLWANTLIYFLPKSLKGCERSDFKMEPYKICSLDGWCSRKLSSFQNKFEFELYNKTSGTVYKFRTKNLTNGYIWIQYISSLSEQQLSIKSQSLNLMSFE